MDGRYDQAVLCGRIECWNYHPSQNCAHARWIRLAVDGLDWQHAEVAAQLRRLTRLPERCKDSSGDVRVPLTWAMVTQLSGLMKDAGYGWRPDPGLNQWIAAEFTRRHAEYGGTSDLAFPVASLSWTPMPHQLAGAYVGALNERLFFADEAGTGKTRTALLTMAELEARGRDPFPAFAVCPASVADQWLEELEETFPDWPAVAYRGPKRKRLSTRYKIYVMSWDTFRADMRHEPHELPPLLRFLHPAVPRTVILDEAHCLCSKSKQSTAAKQVARLAEYVFPLSGTPITKDVGGFWSALQVLDIRSFPDEDRYKDAYTDRYHGDYKDEVNGLRKGKADEFHLVMQGSMRRAAKQDVLPDLPDKTYVTRVVQIPPAHRAAYDEMAEDMIAHLPDTEVLEVMTTLAQLQRLTQLASCACDVSVTMELDENERSPTFGELVPRTHVTMKEPSWKIDELMQIMGEMEGSPLITFSPHTQLVKLAGARAESAGYRVGYLTGKETTARKTAFRKAFQAGEIDLLCCNTAAAGGVGLNLTAASTVVFLERTFAYWQASQNEDRVHRRGQAAEKVTMIDIVAADTVESRVRQAMKDKSRQLSELIRDRRIVESFLGGQPVHVK